MGAGAEASVGVNFVADTRQAVREVMNIDNAMDSLKNTVLTAAKAFLTYKAASATIGFFKSIMQYGATAEMQLIKLETAMSKLAMDSGIPAATLALEEYNKAIAFAERTVFEVSDVIDAVQAMRSINVDPLAEQYKNLKGEAVGVLEILGNTSTSAADVQQRIGSLAGAMSGNTHALMALNGQLSLMPGTLQGVVKGLKPGTKAFQDALMGFISKQPQFQDGMLRMSKTLDGIVVGFIDFPKQIMTAMADVTNAVGVYGTVKNIMDDLYNHVFENFGKILFWGRVMGQYMAGFVKVIWALITPIRALFEAAFQYIVGFQERMTGFIEGTGREVDTLANLMESIQLHLALVFGSMQIRIEDFWASFKKVLDFLGIDGKQVFSMLAIVLGVKLVTALKAATLNTILFAKANWRLMMGKAGLLILVYLLPKIWEWYDNLGTVMKVLVGTVVAVTGAIFLYNKYISITAMLNGTSALAATAMNIAMGIKAVAVTAASAAVWLLNAALTVLTAPITLVILAVLALVGVFIYFWRTSEKFRNFFIGIWDVIKEKMGEAFDWVREKIYAVIDWFKEVYDGAKRKLGKIWDWLFGKDDKKEIKVTGRLVDGTGTPTGKSGGFGGFGSSVLPPALRGAGTKASGGPVSSRSSYLVGERGPELLTMGSRGGSITPNGGGGNSFNININVDARGAKDAADVGKAVEKNLRRSLPEMVRNFGMA